MDYKLPYGRDYESPIKKIFINEISEDVEKNIYKISYIAPFNREKRRYNSLIDEELNKEDLEELVLLYIDYCKNRIFEFSVGSFLGYAYKVDMENEVIEIFVILSSDNGFIKTYNRLMYKTREESLPLIISSNHFKYATSPSFGKFSFNKINITEEEYVFFKENFQLAEYSYGSLYTLKHLKDKTNYFFGVKLREKIKNYLEQCLSGKPTYIMSPIQVIKIGYLIENSKRMDNLSIGHFNKEIKRKTHRGRNRRFREKVNKGFVLDKKIHSLQDFIDFISYAYTKKDPIEVTKVGYDYNYYDFSIVNSLRDLKED